jgi:uncharacterized RDD family membrane protein YckC
MTAAVSAGLVSPAGIVERYDSSIVVRRWGATWIDFLVLFGLVAAGFALPAPVQSLGFAILAAVAVAYFPLFEHVFGKTVGKFVCRVRVVDEGGLRPSWGQALVRTLLRLLEVNPVLLGGVPAGLFVLATRKKQRLGDMVAGTYVLREEDGAYLDRLRATPASARPPLPPRLPPPPPPGAGGASWLAPTNRSGWAIAAGYLGLFAVLMVPAPFALVAGVLALREIGEKPGLGGRGRAVFGIVMGGLFSALLVAVALAGLFGSR